MPYELRMRRKKSPLSTQPVELKGTVSRKNLNGIFYPGLGKNKLKFLAILPKKFHSALEENVLNYEKA
jgi:hypothetical protein